VADRYTAEASARISELLEEPDWLASRRADAYKQFESLPWPDQVAEEWRHTDLRPLEVERFEPAVRNHAPVNALEDLPPDVLALTIGKKGERDALGVRLDSDLVHLRMAPRLAEQGVVLNRIEKVAVERPELVEPYLGTAGSSEFEHKLTSLNSAFTASGSFLYVPRGVHIELPVVVVRTLSRAGIGIFPKVIIVAGEGSSVTYVDHFGGAELGGESLVVPSIEIYAEQGAIVNYLCLQNWPQTVWHLQNLRAVIGRDATVRTLISSFGAKMARSVTQSILAGQGAHTEMLGLYFGDSDQHIDNRTLQLHAAPDTSSNLYYKGALKGNSRAVYSGLVDIEKDAPRADAQQANRNLLLSDGASALPDPFLEIKTSEVVRATHGVSVGRPSEDVLFYLYSRGLEPAEAQNLFVKGFFQEVIDRVGVPQIRELLEGAVDEELQVEDR
jgi:Fe-S cluster assembly protein SufD